MKSSRWLIALALAGMCGISCVSVSAARGRRREKDVSIDQVPAAVKATILKEAGDNTLEEIEEVSVNGKVLYYEAEWHAGGKEIEIKVAPNGKLLAREVEDDEDDDEDDDEEDDDD